MPSVLFPAAAARMARCCFFVFEGMYLPRRCNDSVERKSQCVTSGGANADAVGGFNRNVRSYLAVRYYCSRICRQRHVEVKRVAFIVSRSGLVMMYAVGYATASIVCNIDSRDFSFINGGIETGRICVRQSGLC